MQNEIELLEKEITPQITDLIQIRNSINIQGRALTPDEIRQSTKIDHIENTFRVWKENYDQIKSLQFPKPEIHLRTLKQFKKKFSRNRNEN